MFSRNEEIEREMKEKGLNAPKVKQQDLLDLVESKTFTVLPSGRCMICEVTLKNTFTLYGKSVCVSKENFDREIGERISFEDAIEQLWQLEAYKLTNKLFEEGKRND